MAAVRLASEQVCVCVNCSRAPEGGEDEGLLLLHPYDLPLLPGGTHGYAGRMPHQASSLSDPRELTPAGHILLSVCVFVFFQWQQLYTRQRPIGPDTPFAFAKGFRGQTEKQRGTKNSLRRITALESATVVAAKSMCVRATAGYPGLEAPVSSPGAVAAYFSESRSCSRSGPKQW